MPKIKQKILYKSDSFTRRNRDESNEWIAP